MTNKQEAEFTPGPWRVDPDYCHDIQTANGALEIASVAETALTDGEKPGYYARTANARLIAAAPDLYEALVEAFNVISHACEAGFYVGEGIFEKLNAALAKARGEIRNG